MTRVITVIPDQCRYIPYFLEPAQGYDLYDHLLEQTDWKQRSVRALGKVWQAPRLSAWYGDPHALYRYSGKVNVPLPWFDHLQSLRERVQTVTRCRFNSVLLNYYRDGNDGVGPHSDNEQGLGARPVIASVSLGATRRFILHPRKFNSAASIRIDLVHGSMLIMSGLCQRQWKHSVPKSKKPVGPRINLTFRNIVSADIGRRENAVGQAGYRPPVFSKT